jgi:hypothetical protein
MPLPKPRKGESQKDFTSRCMHESDLPTDNDQRLAACMTAWRAKSRDLELPPPVNADPSEMPPPVSMS